MDRAMHVAMQTMQKTRSTHHGTKSDPVTPDALDLLEQFGTTVTVLRSHEIYGQGEPTESCWRIISGCVRTAKFLEDGRRQIGEFIWVGDLLGMDDLDVHASNAEAVTDVMLRRYPRRMVEALAQSHTGLALRLRMLVVANLRRTYQQMALLGRKTAMERIASFLLDMHRRSTATDRPIVDVPMKMRHRPTRSLDLRARKDDLANAHARYGKNRRGGWRFQEWKPQADGGGGSLHIT